VKTLHLNLASRPYRDYKPVYAVVVITSLAVAFLMLNNVETYYRYVIETKSTRAKIAQLDADADAEKRRAAAADAQLRNVDLVSLDAETKFINAQLAERAFSWSELLDRLERVLPDDARIKNITPTFSKAGLVHLELTFDGKAGDTYLRTLNSLIADPHFANPFPHNVAALDPTTFAFAIGVEYKPSVARVVEK